MTAHIWVRAENKANERRVALVPSDAKDLIAAGFTVTVEKSSQRAIAIEDFQAAGCAIAEEFSWIEASQDVFVLGVKDLPKGTEALPHRHIYFGHVFKDQPGWEHTLGRFASGGGTLYDLECLVDETGRRLAAFGYWAGYAGAAVATQVWIGQKQGNNPSLASVHDYSNRDALVAELKGALASIGEKPSLVVIGALGRCGTGATDLGEQLGLEVSKWDMAETASGGPFPALQQHSLFVNAILAAPGVPVFVGPDDIKAADRKLSVICDVSCDPESTYNPIPIYDRSTTFDDPVIRVLDASTPLDVTAIDHLPSMLPKEASEDYSRQLTPVLFELGEPEQGAWGRALNQFKKHTARI
ncbi:saccharopine dehydrogenase [Alphaproteobacteria bacterium]|jgi:saccharopine dehydrogenase (NAD+, L-lysine forming)|nr:saccharopine dehydrogenase [Alphaproteobacteria bacterium]